MKAKMLSVMFGCIVILNYSSASYASIIDQQQPGPRNYGFWFEKDVIRWQEFTPTMTVLDKIELNITRWGDPGDVIVEICDQQGNALYSQVVQKENIPRHKAYDYTSNWISIDIPEISLNINTPYLIRVNSSEVSSTVENRYFWDGVTNSEYTRGISSVENSWQDYDFCFKTYATPEPATSIMLGLGSLICLRKRKIH